MFSVTKSVCLVFPPKSFKSDSAPNVYSNGTNLDYEDNFKHHGHPITSKMPEDEDI